MNVFAARMFRAVASLLLLSLACMASAADEATLRLEISGLAQAKGKVYFSVYDSPDTWLGEERVVGGVVDISESLQGEVVIATVDLSPGEYAVSIFYDVDDDGELGTNFIGIPNEPVALSNNAKARFGPPKYDDARFDLTSDGLTQTISIKEI